MFPKVFKIKAVTLIELIFAMVILGLAVTAMMGVLGTVSRNAVFSEDTARLSFSVESLMEDIMGKQFDQNSNTANAGTWSQLGVDGGKNSANYMTFTDIDDYCTNSAVCGNVCTNANVIYPLYPNRDFVRTVTVQYANCTSADCGTITKWVSGNASPNNYKIIKVTAGRNGATSNVTLVGLKGAY